MCAGRIRCDEDEESVWEGRGEGLSEGVREEEFRVRVIEPREILEDDNLATAEES